MLLKEEAVGRQSQLSMCGHTSKGPSGLNSCEFKMSSYIPGWVVQLFGILSRNQKVAGSVPGWGEIVVFLSHQCLSLSFSLSQINKHVLW